MQDKKYMPDHHGLFIVLEGADGSGKTTQFRLLAERLKAVGYEVAIFDFPRYELPSSYFVKRYLNGEYGEASRLSPYTASLFYALDRYEAAPQIRQALKAGKIVLANRYVGSNMAHQGSKFSAESQQRGFFVWAESLEFQLLGIPRPTLNIYLKVPPKISYGLIANKTARSYTNKQRDEHEKNLEYLERSSDTYDLLTKLFPKDFKEIDCTSHNQILGIAEINDNIWETIKPLLPPDPPNRAKSIVLNLHQAAMVMPKHISSNIRNKSATSSLSLNPINFEFRTNELSLLAANSLVSSSEFAASLEVNWIRAKSGDDCHYYVPSELPSELKKSYKKTIRQIAELYIKMKQAANDSDKPKKNDRRSELLEVITAVVPLSAFGTVFISTDTRRLKSIIDKLSNTSPKLREVDDLVERLASKASSQNNNASQLSHDNDVLTKPQAIEEIIKNLAQSLLPQTLSGSSDSLKLLEFWPRNEFDLLADSIYPYSNLPRNQIAAELDKWSYQQKAEALSQAIFQKPESLIAQVNYRWDITTDRLKLHHMLRNRLIKDLKQQTITPRYGYEVPDVIEFYGLEDKFMDCFDLSLELYSQLQAAKQELQAGYATLLGHRVRWQFSTSANSWRAYANNPKNISSPHYAFMKLLLEKIAEVHPQLTKFLFSTKAASAANQNRSLKPSKSRNNTIRKADEKS
ncbi:hypothetical protein HYW35_00225 [Candidatus Saccharibacteria bacterium]|nr:hypothetical protein [Candidatus Saccharibacteria bacterium]